MPRLLLTLPLLSVGCDPSIEDLPCDSVELVEGSYTFEGSQHQASDVSLHQYVFGGTPDDPCLKNLELATGSGSQLSVHGGAGDSSASSSLSLDGYGVWVEDREKLRAHVYIESASSSCVDTRVRVVGQGMRMYVDGSEDWGPYDLSSFSLTVDLRQPARWDAGGC